jgi:nitrite reductase (NADH) small subunit
MAEKVEVAKTSEISPSERRFYEVKGKEIAIINVDGEYYAIENFCPHMGGPVGRGPLSVSDEEKVIMCPFHEWRFDLETGDVVFPSKKRVQKYEVKVDREVALEQYDVDVQENEDEEGVICVEI